MKAFPTARRLAALGFFSLAVPVHATTQDSVQSLGGNQFIITLATTVQASVERVWSVLTDYDHHAGFLPYMTMSHLVRQTPDYKLIVQEIRIPIMFWSVKMHVTQKIREVPPTHMTFTSVDGDFKILEGTWTLNGVSPDETALGCVFLVEPKRKAPEWAVRLAARRYLSVMVKRLRARAEHPA